MGQLGVAAPTPRQKTQRTGLIGRHLLGTRIGQKAENLLARLHTSQAGSILPAAAGAMVMITGLTGVAIDGARLYHAKDVLQKSLDAAGLAAGNSATAEDMQTDATAYFLANFESGNASAIDSSITITPSLDGNTFSLQASATIASSFSRLLGYDTFTITANAEVIREVRGMELALVMDNTGSMKGSKMTTMKQAARDLIEIVYGTEDVNTNLYVSLVPYTAAVNVGTDYTNWLSTAGQTFVSSNNYFPDTWRGCVMARGSGEDKTDTIPSDIPFEPYFYADDVDNDWIVYDEEEESTAYSLNLTQENTARGPNLGCGPAITPLIQSKTRVLSAIDQMNYWSRGGTTSNLGLVWGWRTLSPKWRGLWNGDHPTEHPNDYGTAFMDKVAVVLTDGDNQIYDWKGHSPNNGVGPFGSDFTAYDRLNHFGFSTTGTAKTELNNRFAEICSAMKAQGILIYTITFGSGSNGAKSLYQGCASDPAYYFHAPDNSTLATVFETIGRSLSNLRLSQ